MYLYLIQACPFLVSALRSPKIFLSYQKSRNKFFHQNDSPHPKNTLHYKEYANLHDFIVISARTKLLSFKCQRNLKHVKIILIIIIIIITIIIVINVTSLEKLHYLEILFANSGACNTTH